MCYNIHKQMFRKILLNTVLKIIYSHQCLLYTTIVIKIMNQLLFLYFNFSKFIYFLVIMSFLLVVVLSKYCYLSAKIWKYIKTKTEIHKLNLISVYLQKQHF